MPPNGRSIVILGLPRSGTSAVSGTLHRLGAFLGDEAEFVPSDENNPLGYFEDKALTAFNHRCFAFFQMHPLSLRELPAAWPSYPQSEILINELKSLLTPFRAHPVWGFKQPWAALVWPIYAQALAELEVDPQFVLCVRHPAETHASGLALRRPARGTQITPIVNSSVGVWLNYNLKALEAAGNSPLTVVPFSWFLKDPTPFLSQIAQNYESWRTSEAQRAAAFGAVHPDSRHHVADDSDLVAFPSIVGETYRLCGAGARDQESRASLLAKFRTWREMLAPPRLSGTQIGFAWKSRGETESAVQPFMPTGNWQAVSIRISAPPRTEMHGVLYNMPCRAWIRRCMFRIGKEQTEAQLRPGPGSNLRRLQGVLRLDGAYEPRQIMLETPPRSGPYILEMELLLESGLPIVNDSVARVASRLNECVARKALAEIGARR